MAVASEDLLLCELVKWLLVPQQKAQLKLQYYVVLSFAGWEYCVDPEMTPWQAFEKNIHRYRRRRWVRTRLRVMDEAVIMKKMVRPSCFPFS